MKTHILTMLSLALLLPPMAIAGASPSQAAARACWTVVDAPVDGAEVETLCVDADLKASFGTPTSWFGDVSNCGTVALGKGPNLVFDVTLSACDGDLPDHRVSCEATQPSKTRCTLFWGDKSGNLPVMLIPANG